MKKFKQQLLRILEFDLYAVGQNEYSFYEYNGDIVFIITSKNGSYTQGTFTKREFNEIICKIFEIE